MKKPKRRPERIRMVVQRGSLVPADDLAKARLRAKGYHVGDEVFVEVKKPRDPTQHRKAHAFANLLTESLDEFANVDPHTLLKRIQIESGIGCDEVGHRIPGHGMYVSRIPKSLSFESMDEGEFAEVMAGFAHYVCDNYWTDTPPEEVAKMVDSILGRTGGNGAW